jgi:hypothetical protein
MLDMTISPELTMTSSLLHARSGVLRTAPVAILVSPEREIKTKIHLFNLLYSIWQVVIGKV